MIVVDSSALIAVLKQEATGPQMMRALFGVEPLAISAVTLLESRMVAEGAKPVALSRQLAALLEKIDIDIIPFDAAQSEFAFGAFRRFGRGSGHGARLNFGDCAAYALAKSRDAPLLFVGDDFTATDIMSAVNP
jgi:ribonuclease VapC